jgi:hypothetical protein
LIPSFKYSLSLFLICLLALRFTLFMLPSFTLLRSFNHCSSACFTRSVSFEPSSSICILWSSNSQ